ncbi:MAG: hypothetical protein WC850_06365 [Candidatus Gracilibacteria bacterium]
MDNKGNYFRFIQSKWVPFLLGILFIGVFYAIYFIGGNKILTPIISASVNDFIAKFGNFIPALYGILLTIILYLLIFIKWITRLNFWIVNFLLILLVYGFNLFFGIQLYFFEPRYTEVAIYIIDSFSKPMIGASISVLLVSIILIFIKIKKS